jgi:hypothetical protein
MARANVVSKPYEFTTQEDFDAAINPPPLTQCTYLSSSEFVVSISGKDLFSFVTTTASETPTIQLTMYWREDGVAVWKKYQSPFILTGGNGVLSQVLRRPSGINAARHFKFEYMPKYVDLITDISVSVGQ